jgi:DNA-3-methyladenine glycosylase
MGPIGVGRRLERAFYARPTLVVAKELVGKRIVHHDAAGARVSGMIVEVEAYIGESDPACHAAPGPTPRNAPLYGAPGVAYVYLNYGVHHLLNAVTEPDGYPAAVLLRAFDPREGVSTMRRRRAAAARGLPDTALGQGPGNLSKALGVDLRQNRIDLTDGPLTIEDWGEPVGPLSWGPRIGISVGKDRHWRCWLSGHPSVSRPRTPAPRPRDSRGGTITG